MVEILQRLWVGLRKVPPKKVPRQVGQGFLGLVAVLLFMSGCIDLDWMIVAPRFNPWYYTVDYWEFCPYFRLNWWLAYVYTILRIIVGALFLGYLIEKLK